LAALAGPPFLPPIRPRATAAGFFFFMVTAMIALYVSGQDRYVSGYILRVLIEEPPKRRLQPKFGCPTRSGDCGYHLPARTRKRDRPLCPLMDLLEE